MKAYLIDPERRTVREIAIERDERGTILKSLYCAIDCSLVERVADFPIEGHDCWIDEEGALYDEPPHGLICIPRTYQQIYYGRAVVMGYDDEGDSTDATCSADEIMRQMFAVYMLDESGCYVAPLTVLPPADTFGADNQSHASE